MLADKVLQRATLTLLDCDIDRHFLAVDVVVVVSEQVWVVEAGQGVDFIDDVLFLLGGHSFEGDPSEAGLSAVLAVGGSQRFHLKLLLITTIIPLSAYQVQSPQSLLTLELQRPQYHLAVNLLEVLRR